MICIMDQMREAQILNKCQECKAWRVQSMKKGALGDVEFMRRLADVSSKQHRPRINQFAVSSENHRQGYTMLANSAINPVENLL